ncbi:hypothetical protein [Vibrio salinus]|uniref:hypothetical protein n=1 Tax=Vibrio salinus TaxID=2899784 RepID=UPI0035698E7D
MFRLLAKMRKLKSASISEEIAIKSGLGGFVFEYLSFHHLSPLTIVNDDRVEKIIHQQIYIEKR